MTDISVEDDILDGVEQFVSEEPVIAPIDFGGRARRIEDVVDPQVPIAEEFARGDPSGAIDLRGFARRVGPPPTGLMERVTTIGQGATAGAAQGIPVFIRVDQVAAGTQRRLAGAVDR